MRTPDCTCGWMNDWTDSGDRGAARHDHDYRDCPNRAVCNESVERGTPRRCLLPPSHAGDHRDTN